MYCSICLFNEELVALDILRFYGFCQALQQTLLFWVERKSLTAQESTHQSGDFIILINGNLADMWCIKIMQDMSVCVGQKSCIMQHLVWCTMCVVVMSIHRRPVVRISYSLRLGVIEIFSVRGGRPKCRELIIGSGSLRQLVNTGLCKPFLAWRVCEEEEEVKYELTAHLRGRVRIIS